MKTTPSAIEETTRAIIERYQPQEIVLFGSSVRDRVRPGSDMDLLIIKETTKSPPERVREVVSVLPHTVDTDVIVLTPRELREREQEDHYFLKEIRQTGRVIYQRGVHAARRR